MASSSPPPSFSTSSFNKRGMIGWLMFLLVLWFAWDTSISRMIRVMEPDAGAATQTNPATRLVLFVAGTYTACRVALLTCLTMLILFCVMTCVQCVLVLPLLSQTSWVHNVLTWFFDERVLFAPLRPFFLGYHAAVLAWTVVVALAFSCIYATDRDLSSPDTVRSLVVREVMSMALLGMVAYVGVLFYVATRS